MRKEMESQVKLVTKGIGQSSLMISTRKIEKSSFSKEILPIKTLKSLIFHTLKFFMAQEIL